ncbi:hypothetical protein SDC9_169290 [bioreactor metagenome]|uniref:Uncharacterized protein n=1 Tax=bioreactor metagenome TaxID=1076179 RepID=A0A645G4X1_9ZZZZ
MILKERPASRAFSICSRKFVRSLGLSALLLDLFSDSQLIKQTSFSSKPPVITSKSVFVWELWIYLSIFFLLCSSRSPLPGVSQINTVFANDLRYSSIKWVSIIVLPLPVQLFRIISRLSSCIATIRSAIAFN